MVRIWARSRMRAGSRMGTRFRTWTRLEPSGVGALGSETAAAKAPAIAGAAMEATPAMKTATAAPGLNFLGDYGEAHQ